MRDEALLVHLAQQNNPDALEELFHINYPVRLGAMVRITGDARLAEDVSQEAALRAIVNIARFEPRAKFSTWLISIALNVYRNMLRKITRETPMEDMFPLASESASGQTPVTKSVEDTVLGNLAMDEALRVLQVRAPEKRQVFVLKHYYGWTYQEIATALGCPIGTVRSRLHDSIKILHRKIRGRLA